MRSNRINSSTIGVLGFLMLSGTLFTLTAIRCFASACLILLGIDVSRMGRL